MWECTHIYMQVYHIELVTMRSFNWVEERVRVMYHTLIAESCDRLLLSMRFSYKQTQVRGY